MKHMTVLLSTYNGERYLEEQLDSIFAQDCGDVFVLARDDGSTDATHAILDRYKGERLEWYTGGNLGPAQSFMDLVYHAPDSAYYAFADQDDYWYPEKLGVGIRFLEEQSGPALWYCRKRITDEVLETLGDGKDMYREPLTTGFSLMKCTVTGCSMSFNRALREKLLEYHPQKIVMHDIWALLVALSLGTVGSVDQVYMDYRQHANNCLGRETSRWRRGLDRIKSIPGHVSNRERSDMAQELLNGYAAQLQERDRIHLERLVRRSFADRMHLIGSDYFNRESLLDTLCIKILILLGWI